MTPKSKFGAPGPQHLTLKVGGALKQDAKLSDMAWSVPELISWLSRYYHLGAGD